MVKLLPPLDIKYLETMLDALPEPSSVAIGINGNVSGGLPKLYELLGDILGFSNRLEYSYDSSLSTYAIKNATKEEVKGLLRDGAKRREESGDNPKRLPYPVLHKARWKLEGGKVNIELDPFGMSIEYSGEEPPYVAELRQKLGNDLSVVSRTEIGY
jgi:hypothetical protein